MESQAAVNSTLNCTDSAFKKCRLSSTSDQKGEMLYVCVVVSFYSLPIFVLLFMLCRRRTTGKMLDMQIEKYFSGLDGVRKQAMVERIISTNLNVPGNYMSERFAARRGSTKQTSKRSKPKGRLVDDQYEWEVSSIASETLSKAKYSVGSMSNFSVNTDTTCSDYTLDFDLESEINRRTGKPVRLQHAVVCLNARKAGGQPMSLLGEGSVTPVMERRLARTHAGRTRKRPIVTYFTQSPKLPNYHLEPIENPDGKNQGDGVFVAMDSHMLKDIDECDDELCKESDVKSTNTATVARESLGNREVPPDTPQRARRGGATQPPNAELLPLLNK